MSGGPMDGHEIPGESFPGFRCYFPVAPQIRTEIIDGAPHLAVTAGWQRHVYEVTFDSGPNHAVYMRTEPL